MDGRGVLGFPIRLTVAFLIIALFVPSVMFAAELFSENSNGAAAISEAGRIADTASRVWYGGTGCAESITVDIPPGYEAVFGGDGGYEWSYCIMHAGKIVERVFSDAPAVRYPIMFTVSGHAELTLKSDTVGGVYGVVAI